MRLQVLELDANNYFAMGHLGFIETTYLSNYERGSELLLAAIKGDDKEINNDPKFYYQLGTGLQRLGKTDQV